MKAFAERLSFISPALQFSGHSYSALATLPIKTLCCYLLCGFFAVYAEDIEAHDKISRLSEFLFFRLIPVQNDLCLSCSNRSRLCAWRYYGDKAIARFTGSEMLGDSPLPALTYWALCYRPFHGLKQNNTGFNCCG